MMQQLVNQLENKEHIKKTLIDLKAACKEEENINYLKDYFQGDYSLLLDLLHNEDPKVRRASGKILALCNVQSAMKEIFKQYKAEETLFIRKDYLTSLQMLDYTGILPELKECYWQQFHRNVEESEKVHIQEELQQLDRMITQIEGITRHQFQGFDQSVEVLLTCKEPYGKVLYKTIENLPKKLTRQGVMVKCTKAGELWKYRCFDEMLIYLGRIDHDCENEEESLIEDLEVVAKKTLDLQLLEKLAAWHSQGGAFYFRIQMNAKVDADRKGKYIKRLGLALEEASNRQLRNAPSDYELEIRYQQNREGGFGIFLKLATIRDPRFLYRKNVLPVSIKPCYAACLMEMAKEYMKEGAQILDPFCGTGTMLIERRFALPAKDTYGVDIFGEAILMAKENSKEVGPFIHYIQRNFEDFTHDYKFDEIITNMPYSSNNVSRKDVDAAYQILFDKAEELLSEKGYLFIYGNEHSFVKRQLRLRNNYQLVKDFVLDERFGIHWYVILKN